MTEITPMLYTTEIEALRDFYETLGFTESKTWFSEGRLNWMELSFQGTSIMLQLTSSVNTTDTPPSVELYFVCEDVDSIVRTWRRRGIDVPEVSTAFYGMRQLFLKDTDGRTVCFESSQST